MMPGGLTEKDFSKWRRGSTGFFLKPLGSRMGIKAQAHPTFRDLATAVPLRHDCLWTPAPRWKSVTQNAVGTRCRQHPGRGHATEPPALAPAPPGGSHWAVGLRGVLEVPDDFVAETSRVLPPLWILPRRLKPGNPRAGRVGFQLPAV